MTQHSVARAYSIIQEVQELRDKARKLSERNAELAKALVRWLLLIGGSSDSGVSSHF